MASRIGETLRAAREGHGLSIAQAAQDTRITAQFIEAMEADQFEALPAPVYARGFLRSYASYLGLEPEPLLSALPPEPSATATQRTAYDPVPEAPAPSLADPGDQWWPDAGGGDRGLWPGLEPRQTPISEPVASRPSAEAQPPAMKEEGPHERPPAAAPAAASAAAAATPAAPRVAYEHERLRKLRETGVLVEPDGELDRGGKRTGGGGGPGAKTLAIAGAAVFGLVALVFSVFAITGGGGDGPSNLAAAQDDPEPTATTDSGRAAVDTATPRRSVTPKPSTTPNPTGTPEPSATDEPSSTPEPAATTKPPTNGGSGGGGGGNTGGNSGGNTGGGTGGGGNSGGGSTTNDPTPKPPAPSNTPKPPTNTPAPPTKTPVPPTPTNTVIPMPAHGKGLSECPRDGAAVNCGPAPYAIVCKPGAWFLDYGGNFTNPLGWPVHYVDSPLQGAGVCG